MTVWFRVCFILALAVLHGCTTYNYTAPDAPMYAGVAVVSPDREPAIRIVTFNLEHGRETAKALERLRHDPALRDADVVFLQEMDAEATQFLADSLNLHWLYVPATISPKNDRDFGNAILSRWPLRDGRKIILPHRALIGRSQRIAVAATVTIDGREVTLCSTHLALAFMCLPGHHRDQAEHLAEELAGSERVIIGGDMNSGGVGTAFERAGYSWPSRDLGATTKVFSVDHIFVKGLEFAQDPPAGMVDVGEGVSDHRPVWTLVRPTLRSGPVTHARRDASLHIKRAAWLDSTLVRGGRPNEDGWAALKGAGVRTVVSLVDDDDTRERAQRLGMEHVSIPLDTSGPVARDDILRFLSVTQDPARRPLFFHGGGGRNRTGVMAALYRIQSEGWTNGEAIEEMRAFGFAERTERLLPVVRGYVPHRTSDEGH